MPNYRDRTLQMVRTFLQIPNQDDLIFDTDITDVLIDAAISEYSRRRPRDIVSESQGNSESNIAPPANWSDLFSVVRSIMLAAGGNDDQEVDQNEYRYVRVDTTSRTLSTATSGQSQVTLATASNAGYFKDGDIVEIKSGNTASGETNWVSADGNTSTGVVALKNALAATYTNTPIIRKKHHIRFTVIAPNSSDLLKINHTGLHEHTNTATSIPDGDYAAFCHLAAALTAYAIAAKFSQHTDSSLEADAVDYGNLATLWQDRGNEQYAKFKQSIGEPVEGDKAIAGGVFGDVDFRSMYGHDLLLHRTRLR